MNNYEAKNLFLLYSFEVQMVRQILIYATFTVAKLEFKQIAGSS